MSHHSQDDEDRIADKLGSLKGLLGGTGEFPEGKISGGDEGEIAFAVGTLDGKVVVHFGNPVTWLGMLPDEARELAKSLTKRADVAERQAALAALDEHVVKAGREE